jgi:ribosomal protein L11 methyltransferase
MNKDGLLDGSESASAEWLVVKVGAGEVGQAASQAIADCLLKIGGTAVEQSPDGGFTTWVRPLVEPEEVEREVRSRLAEHLAVSDVTCWLEPDRDWLRAWRLGLEARRVGSRIVISPSWLAPPSRSEDILIRVDPQMAFGTGEHGSTRTAIRLLEESVSAGERVLDIGTGSGILAIAAARLGASVVALEADPDAVRTAKHNVRENDVERRVRVVNLIVDEAVLRLLTGARYDLILANVDLGFTRPLLPCVKRLVEPDGRLVAAGILVEETDGFLAAAEKAGLVLLRQEVDDGWWGGLLTPSK